MLLTRRPAGRPGFTNSLELLFVLPLIVITFSAIVQFSQILGAEARLALASREGARVAASGGDTRQIRHAVHAGLLPRERELVEIETNALDSQCQPAAIPPGDDVVVRVSVPTRAIVPSALLLIFANNPVLVGQTVMRKE